VFLEVIGALRKRIVRKETFVGSLDPHIKTNIRNKIKQKITEFLTGIGNLAKDGKVLLADPDIHLRNYLRNVLGSFTRYRGDLIDVPSKKPDRYDYKGLGHWDLQHAMNAKDLNANELVSCDEDFDDLQRLSRFTSITVTIIPKLNSK
jgi:hypothetical protein